jgi:hypothetical protein
MHVQRDTVADADGAVTREVLARAFGRGLLEGIKLKPWRP